MKTGGYQAEAPARGNAPFSRRFHAIAIRLINRLLPGVAMPGYCPVCWTRLEQVGHQLIEWDQDWRVRGIRFWECPGCRNSTGEYYEYVRTGDIWVCS